MKNFFFAATMLASVCTLSSCSSKLLTKSSPVYSLTNSQVSNGYLETQLDIKGEVEGEVTGKFKRVGNAIVGSYQNFVDDNNSISISTSRVDKAKAYALYETTKSANCDIILAPIYTVEISKGFMTRDKFRVKVTGIGADIIGVKQTSVNPNVSK